jgi:hypothetical protein
MSNPVNAQILESVLITNHSVLGHSPETSQGLLNGASSYSISLLMLNAVSTQYAASQIADASVASTCSEILQAGAKAVSGS